MTDAGVVLGIDAGGTSTRAVVASLDGTRIARGRAGGGNPTAHGIAAATTALATAAGQALREYGEAPVLAGVVGVAGSEAFLDSHGKSVVEAAFAELGVAAPPQVIGDVLVAFAAGTPEPSGTVLISGTGAVAAGITGRERGRLADGLGWLFGDHGSGYWLGHQAAKAVVHRLAMGLADGPLTRLVVQALLPGENAGGGRDLANRLIGVAQSRPPLTLAALGPLVSQAATEGDPSPATSSRRRRCCSSAPSPRRATSTRTPPSCSPAAC